MLGDHCTSGSLAWEAPTLHPRVALAARLHPAQPHLLLSPVGLQENEGVGTGPGKEPRGCRVSPRPWRPCASGGGISPVVPGGHVVR